MHESVAAERDGDVRRARRGRREKQEVAGREIRGRIDRRADAELAVYVARERQAVFREDVLREAAAVEAVRIPAAVALRLAP
jgi:hypothetical protein